MQYEHDPYGNLFGLDWHVESVRDYFLKHFYVLKKVPELVVVEMNAFEKKNVFLSLRRWPPIAELISRIWRQRVSKYLEC
jgi:hypothetical protein